MLGCLADTHDLVARNLPFETEGRKSGKARLPTQSGLG
jgi:hypothetical protein